MIHPCTEVRKISAEKGYGLFATERIPMGTITWVRDRLDREISPAELLAFGAELREVILHYSYRNRVGNFMFCWDNTRYINHDCRPNCCITAYEIELAIRDIGAGEEITNHYGSLNIIEPFELPGAEGVVIGPQDLLRHAPSWDRQLESAFQFINRVEQPLRRHIGDDKWRELSQIGLGERSMRSVASCYYDAAQSW